jgi:hypothetical protein
MELAEFRSYWGEKNVKIDFSGEFVDLYCVWFGATPFQCMIFTSQGIKSLGPEDLDEIYFTRVLGTLFPKTDDR